MKLWAAAAGAATVLALTVLGPGGSPSADAKGPNRVEFEFYSVDNLGAVVAVPASGAAIGTGVELGIDATAPNPSPSNVGFFDTTVTTSNGSVTQASPGAGAGAGSGAMAAGAIGASAGTIGFSIKTNVIFGLAGTSNIATLAPFTGALTNCGDNDGAVTTRAYTAGANPSANEMVVATKTFGIFQGNMTARLVRADGLFGNTHLDPGLWNSAQYAFMGGPLIQTFDDDNNNGVVDSLAADGAAPGTKVEPTTDGAGNTGHPWATGPVNTYVSSGVPETQHDTDGNGLPDGLEFQPDFLGDIADALGLGVAWTSRTYGIADTFTGLTAPTDVHFMGFDLGEVAGVGGTTFTVLTNPFSAPNPASQGTQTCTPFSTVVKLQQTTTAAPLCQPASACGPVGPGPYDAPAAVTDTGDAVSRVVATGGVKTTSIFVTDGDDYDQDGAVGPAELCPRDTTSNSLAADADGDLTVGICDADPLTWNNDGDADGTSTDRAANVATLAAGTAPCHGVLNFICDNDVDNDRWVNNLDNCETAANTDQEDNDGDGVGDVCDDLVTTDTISLLPSGKGAGLPTSLSHLLDNDLLCSDSWTVGAAESATDGPNVGQCTDKNDLSDEGIEDGLDDLHDEDGDSCSDMDEVLDALNPMDPLSFPASGCAPSGGASHIVPVVASCIGNHNGGTFIDTDNDKLRDSCEAGAGAVVGDDDTDNDGVKDGMEYSARTHPGENTYDDYITADTDDDGCSDVNEKAGNSTTGGNRHPGNYWDFFDVNNSGDVDLSDALLALAHFGHAPGADATDQHVDRIQRLAGTPGFLVESNDGVDLADALAALTQFGHACTRPGAIPVTGAGRYS